MDASRVADALVEWAIDTLPDLKGTYDHDPDSKTQPLPDLAVSVASEETRASDPTLGLPLADLGIEQATLHSLRASLLLMVDPEDAGVATEQLQDFVRDLREAVKADQTLGGRVFLASPYIQASYEPPFVEFDDGTSGRAATFSIVITELI
jgi:hypothetical protein